MIVTNPEVSSVRDSDRILGILDSKSKAAEEGREVVQHLVITRYSPNRVNDGEMLSVEDIIEILGIQLLGVIPESEAVLSSSNKGDPVVLDSNTNAGQAYSDLISRFLGDDVPHRFLEAKKKGFISRLLGG